jgi:hypothetical protein
MSLGLLSYGGYLAVSNYTRFGLVAAVAWSGIWFISGGLLLLLWLVGSLVGYSRNQPVVRLYAQGLYIEKVNPLVLHWEEIDGIASGALAQTGFLGRTPSVRYRASLYPARGRPVYLYSSRSGTSGLADLPELVRRIKAHLYPSLRSELVRMFRSGLPLYFGPIIVDQTGLCLRRKVPLSGTLYVPWGNVKHITIQSGYFLVELDQQRIHRGIPETYRLPVTQIPNLELLLKIIDQGVSH